MPGRTSTTAGSPTASAAGACRATSSATSTSPSGATVAVPGPRPADRCAPGGRVVNRDPRPAGAYQGPVRAGAGEAAAGTGRLRRGPRTGRAAGQPRAGRRGPVADPAQRRRDAARAGPGRRRQQPDRPRRRLRPRPPLVPRPHGAQRPAAGRADGARLPRLVRDLQRQRLPPAAADRPVQPLPLGLLRLLPRPLQGGHRRSGDAAVAERRRKHQAGAERELRPRDDGALLARRRPRRLQRGRHPRTGAGADRLAL